MNFKDKYIDWYKANIFVGDVDDWKEIVTPFLDRNNDHIVLYMREHHNKIILTDDGQTFSNLQMIGFTRSEKRSDIIGTIFRGFQIDWTEDSTIEITCEKSDFPNKLHCLIQTIIAVDNLGYFTQENIRSMFFEDVAAFLEAEGMTYHANKQLSGKSGFEVNFAFNIPAQKNYRKAFIQLMNNPKSNYKPLLFEWSDTQLSRGDSLNVTLINDTNIQPSNKFINALETYEVAPILWSNKEELFTVLAS